jgi:hypothetical protein
VDTKGLAFHGVDAAEAEFNTGVRHRSGIALEHGQPISRPNEEVGAAVLSPGGEQSIDTCIVKAPLDATGHPPAGQREPEVSMEGLLVHEMALEMLPSEPALDDLDVDLVPRVTQLRLMQ